MIVVRQYGLLPPVDWAEDCREQLWLQNKLWNTLVEIEHENRKAWNAVFEQDAEYAAAIAELRRLCDEVDAQWDLRRAGRAASRSKQTDDDAAVGEKIAELSRQRSELWQKMKKQRNALKAQFTVDLEAVETDRRAKAKAARQTSGLYWCNYNAVMDSYATARSRAMKTGAELRFHAFDGSGRFVNQIQGGMSVEDLFAGRNSQVRIAPLPEDAFTAQFRGDRRRKARTTLTVTAYTGKDVTGRHFRRNVTFPMIMHRPIPAGVRIKEVEVVGRRDGAKLVWSVVFTCTDDSEPPSLNDHPSRAACGINFGWRTTQDGIRIASLIDSKGQTEHILFPRRIIDRMDHCDRLQSIIDTESRALRDKIAIWLKDDVADAPNGWRDMAEQAYRSRSNSKLHRLAIAWRAWEWRIEWRSEMATWRKHVGRLERERDGLRKKAAGERLDVYRNIARALADRYAIIGIGQMDLKQAATITDDGLPAPVRSIRQRVALSLLIEWLRKQAAKTGALVVEAERPVTTTCHVCGKREKVAANTLVHRCGSCNSVWDRDINAATIALQDVTRESAAA